LATKKIRVHELARELGLTNKELLDISQQLGIGVKSASSSIEDPQADRVRRKVDSEGLRREVQPEEPAKKTTKAASAPSESPAAPAPVSEAPTAPPAAASAPSEASSSSSGEAPGAPSEGVRVVRTRTAPPRPTPVRTPSPNGPTTIRPTQRTAAPGPDGDARVPRRVRL
jgi:translation initiation factor IF-2